MNYSLRTLLSSLVVLGLKAQGYHWNVTGKHFFELHAFFQKIYEFYFDQSDDIAERMRALGMIAPQRIGDYMTHSVVEEDDNDVAIAEEMVQSLIDDQDKLISFCHELCVECDNNNDLATQDMVIQFIKECEKFQWMAKSYLN